MPFSNYPQGFANGINIRGMPLLQMQPGQVFWVGNGATLNPYSSSGSDGNPGTFNQPMATIQACLSNRCKQGRGDIIMVLPGHYETIADAATLALNCAGVAIIGTGAGGLRPRLRLNTATTANIQLRSTAMSIQNFVFEHNFADIASVFTAIRASCATSTISGTTLTAGTITGNLYPGMLLSGTGVTPGTYVVAQLTGTATATGTYQVWPSQTVSSTTILGNTHDFAIDNCEFRDLSTVLNALTVFTASGTANCCDGFSMTNCKISSLATTAATTAIKTTVGQDRWSILNNFGNWAVLNDTACMVAAGAANLTNFQFGGNRLNKPNTSSTGGSFISTSGTAWTGHCYDNYMWQLDNTAGIWIPTGTKLAFSQNFSPITGAADASGLINPAAA